MESGCPPLRPVLLIECGTRAVLAATSGPRSDGGLTCAGRLPGALDRTVLLLAGADANQSAADVQTTGAQFLMRSYASRAPTPFQHPGGRSCPIRTGYGVLPTLADRPRHTGITLTLAGGTVRHGQRHLLTSLLNATPKPRHPAAGLTAPCHEQWQPETPYVPVRATMPDGRVLRPRTA